MSLASQTTFGEITCPVENCVIRRKNKITSTPQCSGTWPGYVVTCWWVNLLVQGKAPGWACGPWILSSTDSNQEICLMCCLGLVLTDNDSFILKVQNSSPVLSNMKYISLRLNITHFTSWRKKYPSWCSESWLNCMVKVIGIICIFSNKSDCDPDAAGKALPLKN